MPRINSKAQGTVAGTATVLGTDAGGADKTFTFTSILNWVAANIGLATDNTDGLMAAADKEKLGGLPEAIDIDNQFDIVAEEKIAVFIPTPSAATLHIAANIGGCPITIERIYAVTSTGTLDLVVSADGGNLTWTDGGTVTTLSVSTTAKNVLTAAEYEWPNSGDNRLTLTISNVSSAANLMVTILGKRQYSA